MKKLLFATALVASAAAFADGPTTFNWIGFEGYAVGATNENGVAELAEDGLNDKGAAFFWYQGDADGSSVKLFGNGEGEVAAPNITRPAYFGTTTPNAKYLELSTEGGTLWRSINDVGSSPTDLGSAQTVGADGIYLDTLVQFTPTEDGGAPELTQDDKLAIWLNVDSNQQTNLMVRAAYPNDDGTDTSYDPTNFVLSTAAPVVAGQWYRLTVKTIADATKAKAKNPEAYQSSLTGFEIYLDGVQLAATESTVGAGFIDLATDAGEFGWLDPTTDADFVTYLQSGKLFLSLCGPTLSDTLKGVGFKGSGALDDIVWTEADPFANSSGGAEWIDSVTNVFVGADLTPAQTALITSWATANNITVAAGSEEIAAAAYLLNLTTLPGAVPELTITSIEEGADAWTLTVAASVGDSALALPATINGEVKLTQAATLAGLATATPTTVQMTIANGTGTVTVAKDAATAKFMKVGIGIATPAQE